LRSRDGGGSLGVENTETKYKFFELYQQKYVKKQQILSVGAPVFQPGSVGGFSEEGGEGVVEPDPVFLGWFPARSR
jgi:hypothetical protein